MANINKYFYLYLSVLSFLLSSCWNNNTNRFIPDFSFRTLEGKNYVSQDLKGKIVVLKIWATWCGDCIQELPEDNRLVEKYSNKSDLVFLAFTDDDSTKVLKLLDRYPSSYQQITNAKEIKLMFQPGPYKEIPKHIIVNKTGKIVLDISGSHPDNFERLSEQIDQLL